MHLGTSEEAQANGSNPVEGENVLLLIMMRSLFKTRPGVVIWRSEVKKVKRYNIFLACQSFGGLSLCATPYG